MLLLVPAARARAVRDDAAARQRVGLPTALELLRPARRPASQAHPTASCACAQRRLTATRPPWPDGGPTVRARSLLGVCGDGLGGLWASESSKRTRNGSVSVSDGPGRNRHGPRREIFRTIQRVARSYKQGRSKSHVLAAPATCTHSTQRFRTVRLINMNVVVEICSDRWPRLLRYGALEAIVKGLSR
eukprot:4224041-Prymnesium_polylepis.1